MRYAVEQRDTFWGKKRWCVVDTSTDYVVDEGNTRKWAQKHCAERNNCDEVEDGVEERESNEPNKN